MSAVLAIALAGCGSGQGPTPSPTMRASDLNAEDEGKVFHGSRHDYTVAVAECLKKAGWDAEVSPMTEDGGTSLIFDVPEEQNDELD